jgi:hypothetical protein
MFKERLGVAASKADAERRTVPRCFADQQVVVSAEGEKPLVMSGRVRDASPKGMRLEHERPLKPGAVVHVLTPSMDLVANVVWTRRIETRWESGLRTDDSRTMLLIRP